MWDYAGGGREVVPRARFACKHMKERRRRTHILTGVVDMALAVGLARETRLGGLRERGIWHDSVAPAAGDSAWLEM